MAQGICLDAGCPLHRGSRQRGWRRKLSSMRPVRWMYACVRTMGGQETFPPQRGALLRTQRAQCFFSRIADAVARARSSRHVACQMAAAGGGF